MSLPNMNARTFAVFIEPNVADPAWQIAYSEILPGGEHAHFSDYSELKAIIDDCERRRIEYFAAMKARSEMLEALGMTWEEYHRRVDERKKQS